jgi:serpin B
MLAGCKPTAAAPDPAPATPSSPSTPPPISAPTSTPTPASGDAEAPTSVTRAAESDFAARLYAEARKTSDTNVTMSPLSVRTALAMAWAGARGQTADEMARTLGLSGSPDEVHSRFASMLRDLTAVTPPPQYDWQAPAPTLKIADRLWGQAGRQFLTPFLDTLSTRYGASLVPIDFAHAPGEARDQINRAVSDATDQKITDLLAPGMVTSATALVMTNAVYMKAAWAEPFMKPMTKKANFRTQGGRIIQADLMDATEALPYAEVDGAQVITLPYASSSLAMTLVLPKDNDGLPALEQAMGPDSIARWTSARGPQRVHVVMPRFRIASSLSLGSLLARMGMPSAFDVHSADFSGMDGTRELFISVVVQKTFVAVDEAGTEAAAATAVSMAAGAAPMMDKPVEFRADHPFFFCVRDSKSGAVLFTGRVVDPTLAGH